MKIVVIIKLVPDLVEEITVNADGKSLDTTWMRMIINEFDDHALEQAILLKEKLNAQVTVISLEHDGVDEVLFTAYAKGVDQVIKLTGDFSKINNHALARCLSPLIKEIQPDLIFTGVQANNDLDGSLGSNLAACVDMPFIGYISHIKMLENKFIVRKEYPGGVIAEMEATTPVVLGIQAAETPPRYVAVSKVRQIMKTANIDEREASELNLSGGVDVVKMFQPITSNHAEMITGNPEEVANRLIGVFKDIGVIK